MSVNASRGQIAFICLIKLTAQGRVCCALNANPGSPRETESVPKTILMENDASMSVAHFCLVQTVFEAKFG